MEEGKQPVSPGQPEEPRSIPPVPTPQRMVQAEMPMLPVDEIASSGNVGGFQHEASALQLAELSPIPGRTMVSVVSTVLTTEAKGGKSPLRHRAVDKPK